MTQPKSGQLPPTPKPDVPDQPLVRLSEGQRRTGAAIVLLLACAHLIWPEAAIDGVFLGLVTFAAVLLLFDLEKFEWKGMTLRRRSREVAKRLALTQLPQEHVRILEPPELTSNARALTEHREPVDLMPPTDPLERLLWATEQIRIELAILAGNAGYLPLNQPWSAHSSVLAVELARRSVIPTALIEPIETTRANRNAAVHQGLGIRVLGEESVALALETLVALRSIPRNYHKVVAYPVKLYPDRSMTDPLDIQGVKIAQFSDDGSLLGEAVYPTDRTYRPGAFVTWNWNMAKVEKRESWYADSTAQVPHMAFSQAAFFAGKEYPDQWGVAYRF